MEFLLGILVQKNQRLSQIVRFSGNWDTLHDDIDSSDCLAIGLTDAINDNSYYITTLSG